MIKNDEVTPPNNNRFTADELAFLEQTDADRENRAKVFSFDVDIMVRRITRGRMWEQVLQGHLYFDHVVTQMLTEELRNPQAVNVKRMSFAQKVDLLEAMGLVDKAHLAPIRSINDLRNKLAHELNFKVSGKAICDLSNCTPKHLRDSIGKMSDSKRKSLRLFELLLVNLLNLDVIRQRLVLSRLNERYGMLRLRRALEKAEPYLPTGSN